MIGRSLVAMSSALLLIMLAIESAAAHHVMDGRMPTSFLEGLLSGLGHPIIGLDHLAAVVAVGCLAAVHRGGAVLAVGFVIAMIVGAAVHVGAITVPAIEVLVAISVLALGGAAIARDRISSAGTLVIFVLAGLLHGYALAESIVGAQPVPFYAYFVGLIIVQSGIALTAMAIVRKIADGPLGRERIRLAGAAILGIGIAVLVQQIVPAA